MGRFALICLFVALPSSTFACLWDYDTLKMERQRFPEVYELILGKFLRHSDEFYRWRIEDRKKKLESDPNRLDWYDDLAVAYDKTGQQGLAIETILKKDKLKPDMYETYANLGTFHIHGGDFDKGLTFIDKAIKINPDAHFGREVYQQLLVKYVNEKKKDGKLNLPLDPESHEFGSRGFSKFVIAQQKIDKKSGRAVEEEIKKAIKGVAGMMHFGHYDSPILLEVMGDLLMSSSNHDARRLASRAWLKAAYEAKTKSATTIYRQKAADSLKMQLANPPSNKTVSFKVFERNFKSELKEATAWFAELRQNEIRWIDDEYIDPEKQYSEVYFRPDGSNVADEIDLAKSAALAALVCLGIALVLAKCKQGLISLKTKGRD
jgi:tetratricopeptide (TPR) repeat protein